jgi:antitoxin component YwqK of YwqJK toxin-antitoxin module
MIEQINQYDSQGRKHGTWERYYKEDTLNWREYYLHGNPLGLWKDYRRDSTVFKKVYHLNIK